MTPTLQAYAIIKRAKELGPSMQKKYGNDVEVTLDEDALVQACVEVLEEMSVKPDCSKCPKCGGPADNGNDRCVPPNPYCCSKCTELEADPNIDGELMSVKRENSSSNPSRSIAPSKARNGIGATVSQSNGSGADQPEKHSRSSDGVDGDTGGEDCDHNWEATHMFDICSKCGANNY